MPCERPAFRFRRRISTVGRTSNGNCTSVTVTLNKVAPMPTPRYVAIANPDGKRWQAYSQDLHAFWERRGVRPEVAVVPWSTVVPRDGNLDGLPAFDRPALVRLESPGRDFAVTKLLLQAGEREMQAADPTDWTAVPYRK